MTHNEYPDLDPGPAPPAVFAAAYLAVSGIVHLVLAALFDCLQRLNLVLGLLDLAVAVLVFVLLAKRKKRQLAWWEGLKRRIRPDTAGPR